MDTLARFVGNRCIGDLTAEQLASLDKAISYRSRVPARATLVERGEPLGESTILLEGFMVRYLDDQHGRRQVVCFHVPGDFVDLHGFLLQSLDHSIATVTSARIATIPHRSLQTLTDRDRDLATKLWALSLRDAAMHREWLFRLGRLDAIGRVAHFLAETNARLQAIGMSDGSTFALPISQSDIGDIAGLTSVHTNRVLRSLRVEKVCALRSGVVEIQNRARLEAIGQFDPLYLYLKPSPGDQDMLQKVIVNG